MDMSWIETSLTRLEGQLRELFEGDPAADGFPRKLHSQLRHALVSALHASLNSSSLGFENRKSSPPGEYTLLLAPLLAEQVLTHPVELDRLAQQLATTANRAGWQMTRIPDLRVVADPNATGIRVVTASRPVEEENARTSILNAPASAASTSSGFGKPFLIINGLSTYPLSGSVINVGRDPTNHIRIDDQRVSRMHAQIRLIQGRYMIFDLDSQGGTAVNGIRAASHLLSTGDVISLAGVPMVYGEEHGPQQDYTQEVSPLPPPPVML
jgi:hypothetical protein